MINDACALTWEGLSVCLVLALVSRIWGRCISKGNIGLPRRAEEMGLWLELMDFA